jgi:CRP-like cAMP-binding protein
MDVKVVKTTLKQCELFKTFDDEEIEVLMLHGQMKELPRGKIIYLKGQKSDDTFCAILSGAVNIVAKDGHVVREIGRSQVIGEVALSNPHRMRTATVITKEPVELLEWNVNQIKEKIPILWKKLLKLAWQDISNYYEE